MEKAFDEAREDGGDHAEGEHVEGDGEEDEGGGGAAAFGWMGDEGLVEFDEFGLGEQRVRCFDLLGRVFGRVWHVCGGCAGRLRASLREFSVGFLEDFAVN